MKDAQQRIDRLEQCIETWSGEVSDDLIKPLRWRLRLLEREQRR